MTTRTRFFSLISLLLITGFLITSVVGYMVSVSMARKDLTDSILPLTSDNIYSEIQKDLIRPIFISSMMSSDTFLRDWVMSGEQDIARMTRYLSEIRTKYQAITSFFVSEKTGNYYFAGGVLKHMRPNDPRDVWYYRVRSMQEPYELNLDPDLANLDTMTIFINHKVFDYNGNFIGATGCGLSVDSMTRLLRDYEQRYQRHIYFVDPQGNITFSADKNTPHNLSQIRGLADLGPKILHQEQGGFSYERGGQTFHLNTRFLKELNWFLLVEQSLEPEIRSLRRTLFLNLGLSLAIGLVILVIVQQTIAQYQRQLEEMAATDKLTGLCNRHSGETLFNQAIREADRTKGRVAVLLMDLDHFKRINDTYGHHAGDLVLVVCSKVIKSCLRQADIVCRWGGEEFLVLLKDCSLEDAYNVAEKIRLSLEQENIVLNACQLHAQCSLGVAERQEGESWEALVIRADKALYQAKNSGRNRTSRG
ncbi:MAG: sensor domain-containing diguanylate cyclase [Desulfobulbus sp.]|nr:sensor domain-containing diguanylate cyclase [Desulfobulbus sp.]